MIREPGEGQLLYFWLKVSGIVNLEAHLAQEEPNAEAVRFYKAAPRDPASSLQSSPFSPPVMGGKGPRVLPALPTLAALRHLG